MRAFSAIASLALAGLVATTAANAREPDAYGSVSYTHLTLPTILRV